MNSDRAFSVSLALTIAVATTAAAQDTRLFGAAAWLASPVPIPAAVVRQECVKLPRVESYVVTPESSSCAVIRSVVLDSAIGLAWSYALYRHMEAYRVPGSVQLDSVVELELVLLHGPAGRSTDLVAVAHVRAEYDMIYGISAQIAPKPAGALLAVEFCFNGTGGCWQEFQRFRGGRWRDVGDPHPLLEAALRGRGVRFAAGGHRLARTSVDVRTLRGTGALYGPDDGNCCPSRRVEFALRLAARGFQVSTVNIMADSL